MIIGQYKSLNGVATEHDDNLWSDDDPTISPKTVDCSGKVVVVSAKGFSKENDEVIIKNAKAVYLYPKMMTRSSATMLKDAVNSELERQESE
ncbi:hypothetical protein PT282_01260 [Bifidobacterium sp. ESL0763]|uniref:hypothetical protein n=1 Tax=Bifidobacterium sp. ESL0763 TaxID=2983227 RepID=UPI0023F63612|nr:hypothetical protein [Bifidobacterium sp. ESL0763]MDF7663311.1 hypothetical protein [Bifidobacterium sp. ESL0763]